jgi:hypothetical protein
MDREHYSLEKSIEILKDKSLKKIISVEDLIYFAAWGYGQNQLDIYILTAPFLVVPIHIDKNGVRDEYQPNLTKIAKLSRECVQEIEGGHDADVLLDKKPFYGVEFKIDEELPIIDTESQNGFWHYELRRRNTYYPEYFNRDQLQKWKVIGLNIDVGYPPPIKISECNMVVMADDLNRFKQSLINQAKKPDKSKSQDRPNGYVERHAKNRAEVLRAAKYVLENYPKKCRFNLGKGRVNAKATAKCIYSKADEIWPETKKKLLSNYVMAGFISGWVESGDLEKNVE